MEYWAHDISNDEKKEDFCNHFKTIFIQDTYPSSEDTTKAICPVCKKEYFFYGLTVWKRCESVPSNAIEGIIDNDNDAIES